MPNLNIPGLSELFDHMADAVYLLNPETSDIIWGNRQAWEMLGMEPEDIVNHSVLSLQKDVHGAPQWNEIANIIRSDECFRFIGRHLHKQGHEVDVEVNTTHFNWQGSEYFLSVARNITNRLVQESAASGSEVRILKALNDAVDGAWRWTIATGQVHFSAQLKRMLGYGPDEMPGVLETWKNNVHPDDAPLVMAALQEHLDGKRSRYHAEYRIRNRNGHYLWVDDRGKVCEWDEQGNPAEVVGLVYNITDRKHIEQQLQELASYDSLTGLLNRREAMRVLKEQMELSQRLQLPLGIAYMDVDHFKPVNDLYGHETGDKVLRLIAEILKESVRSSDIVSRWGGEEFILISHNTGLNDIHQLAEKLRSNLQQELGEHTPPITISIGVTVTQGNEEIAHVLARADRGLYRAKANGRNRVEVIKPVN